MTLRSTAALAAVLLSFLAEPIAVGADSPAATVDIQSFAFVPQEITVKPGTTITWTNKDQTAHSVVSREGKFASKGMDTDDRYTFTFTAEGDYAYFCSLHPHMIGTIHVRAH